MRIECNSFSFPVVGFANTVFPASAAYSNSALIKSSMTNTVASRVPRKCAGRIIRLQTLPAKVDMAFRTYHMDQLYRHTSKIPPFLLTRETYTYIPYDRTLYSSQSASYNPDTPLSFSQPPSYSLPPPPSSASRLFCSRTLCTSRLYAMLRCERHKTSFRRCCTGIWGCWVSGLGLLCSL